MIRKGNLIRKGELDSYNIWYLSAINDHSKELRYDLHIFKWNTDFE